MGFVVESFPSDLVDGAAKDVLPGWGCLVATFSIMALELGL